MGDIKFEDMKYSELQKLAKSNGIRANMKIDKLVKALKQYYDKDNSCTTTNTSISSNPSSSEQDSGKENSPVVSKTKSKRGRGKKNVKTEVVSSEEETKVEEDTVKPIQTKMTRKSKKSRKDANLLKSPAVMARKSLTATPSVKKTTPSSVKSPAVFPRKSLLESIALKKSTSSAVRSASLPRTSLAGKTSSTVKSPALQKQSPQIQKRKRTLSGTRESTSRNEAEKISGEPTTKRQRISNSSSTKSTPQTSDSNKTTPKQEKKKLSSSPGVKIMLQAMEGLSSEQMRATLLEQLDKKVQKSNSNKNSPSESSSTSSIPRFTAFLAKKNEQKKTNVSTPDWKKIHKKEFSKWDSIDVYMEKKRKRAECLTGSLRKAQQLLTDTQSAVNRLKNTKTPTIAKVVKPDSSARASFQSPAVFKPSTISTKNLNLKFGGNKTPTSKSTIARKTVTPKISHRVKSSKTMTPLVSAVSKPTPKPAGNKTITPRSTARHTATLKSSQLNMVKTTTPRSIISPKTNVNKSSETVSPRKASSENSLTSIHKPGRKSFGDRLTKGVTPFKSVAINTSIMNSSVQKSTFDLKASLSKPMSWKPHKGKLKPMDLNTAYKNFGIDKNNYKTPQTQTLKDRRRDVAANRADKKFKTQMSKRGISAS